LTNAKLIIQCFLKVAVHLGYGTLIWLSVSKLPLQCAVVSLYSVVKQRLKCNTGQGCNCLIQFLLTMVLPIDFQHLLQVHSNFLNGRYIGYSSNTVGYAIRILCRPVLMWFGLPSTHGRNVVTVL
jgi:hypothetical protein